jgi:hypothetical protein
MRQVLSDQRLRSHPCLVATYDVTGKNAPAAVELYALGRQAKGHIIVQQLCEVWPHTHALTKHLRARTRNIWRCCWMQGGDLYQYMLTLQPFSEPLAKYFFKQLIDGIAAMHDSQSFHGVPFNQTNKQRNKHGAPRIDRRAGRAWACGDSQDLKMENLMIGKDQETGAYSLRVGDFGLMRVRSSNVPGAASAASAMDEPHAHVLRAQSSGVVSCRRPSPALHNSPSTSCERPCVLACNGGQARFAAPCHICTRTGLVPATSAPGLGGGKVRRLCDAAFADAPREARGDKHRVLRVCRRPPVVHLFGVPLHHAAAPRAARTHPLLEGRLHAAAQRIGQNDGPGGVGRLGGGAHSALAGRHPSAAGDVPSVPLQYNLEYPLSTLRLVGIRALQVMCLATERPHVLRGHAVGSCIG